MADKRRYTFTEKKRSANGVFAAKMALASFVLFLVDAFISFLYQGAAGTFTGAVGFAAMFLAVYGFVSGMKSFGEKETSPVWPVIGTIGSGIMLIGWLVLFLAGIG